MVSSLPAAGLALPTVATIITVKVLIEEFKALQETITNAKQSVLTN